MEVNRVLTNAKSIRLTLNIDFIDKRRSTRKLSVPDSLEEEDADLQSGSNSDQFLESCCIYLCKSFKLEMATRLKKMVLTGGGVFVQEYQPTSVTHMVVPSNSLDPQ